MPKAVDKRPGERGTGNALFNPNRNGVGSWEDPMSAIGSDMREIGSGFRDVFSAIGALFGLPSPEEILVGVAQGIGTVLIGAVELVSGLGGFFAGLIGGVINSIQIPVLDSTKVLNLPGLLSGFQNLLNGIVRGHSGVPDAIGAVEDVEVVFGDVRQVQFGLITLADLGKAPDNAPFYVSPNPFEDVSFPRRDLKPVETPAVETTTMTASGSTVSPGTSTWNGVVIALLNGHKHNITVPTPTRPHFTIPAGTLALSVLRITKDRVANMVRFMAGGDTPAGDLLVGLYLIDPANGNMTRVYDFGDISDEVDTGSLIYECSLEMAEDLLLDAGSLYAVGILPLTGSFTVAGIPRQRSVPDPVIYPQGATELSSPRTSLPTSIAESTLNHDASHCIWVSVGQTVPTTITPVNITIDFDAYANNGNWVSPAVKNFGNGYWLIQDGKLYCTGPSVLFAAGYYKAFLTLQRCATDNMFAEIVIGSGWTAESIGAADHAYVRTNAEGTEGVAMAVSQQGGGDATVTIRTATNMLGAGTVRSTSSGTFQALPGDRFRIEAVHDEDDDYTTFTCTRNGEPIPVAVWADTGDIAPRGVAWRRAGAQSNAASYNFNVHYAAGIDLFRAGDLGI